MIAEIEYWKSVVTGLVAPEVKVFPYVPETRQLPSRILSQPTAWKGMESILGDLIQRFNIGTRHCLEFGVEYGYSTAALSSFFDSVTGVDIFCGDKHTVNKSDIFVETSSRLAAFNNIRLVRSDYRDWIVTDHNSYDLVHVDIVHTYLDTFTCGLWSANHAQCAIFHDTLSFPAVKRAVLDIARQTGKRFYNFEESYGLGILV
ncbi:MAG TPA: class I SAM-dependent methyltransferase [Terriglobales bacterium]|nr:class I SAM-dependent methyltransferase [Terriglobales bacterium]